MRWGWINKLIHKPFWKSKILIKKSLKMTVVLKPQRRIEYNVYQNLDVYLLICQSLIYMLVCLLREKNDVIYPVLVPSSLRSWMLHSTFLGPKENMSVLYNLWIFNGNPPPFELLNNLYLLRVIYLVVSVFLYPSPSVADYPTLLSVCCLSLLWTQERFWMVGNPDLTWFVLQYCWVFWQRTSEWFFLHNWWYYWTSLYLRAVAHGCHGQVYPYFPRNWNLHS